MIDRKLNIVMVLFGALGGALGHIAGQGLFALSWPRPVMTALYMAVVGLLIVGFVVLAETLFPMVNGVNWKRNYAGITWRYLVPAIVVPMLLIGGLAQLIYQTDFTAEKGRDVYILIDRSGSMEWNDPSDERLAAMRRLAAAFDTKDRMEIIMFDHTAEVLVPLSAAGADAADLSDKLTEITPRGGTDFNAALSLAYERITTEASAARDILVILLSDGESEVDSSLLSQFSDIGVKINTVGLLLEKKDGEAVLSYIARNTFGQFVLAENTDQLDLAFSSLYQAGEQFILAPKTQSGVNGLQWLLYILAGLILGSVTAFIFDNRYIIWPLSIGGTIGGLLAGGLLCMPIGLLLPAMVLGALYPLFALFSKTPPLAQTDEGITLAQSASFLRPERRPAKTHGRF